MNLSKHNEFFNPNEVKEQIHIIGCGAIGSHLAEMMARMGVPKLFLYDFDVVAPHNITNQMFIKDDIGFMKLACIGDILEHINPNIELITFEDGYTYQPLAGYVFLAIDDIELRQEIVKANRFNQTIKAIFDFRMRLTDAQHYAANWKKKESYKKFLDSMSFSSEEAKEATPVSACGTTLNVLPTVRAVTALGIANWINFTKTGELKEVVLIDSFHQILDAF